MMAYQRAGVCVLFLVVGVLEGQTAALTCAVHMLSNGSAFYNISEVAKPGCGIDLAINGIAVANEEEFNKSVVVVQTNNSFLLNKHYTNTTYKVSCSKSIEEVICNGPAIGGLIRASHDGKSWGIVLAVVTAVVLLLLIFLLLAMCWWKKKGCFKRGYKNPAGDPEGQEGMVP